MRIMAISVASQRRFLGERAFCLDPRPSVIAGIDVLPTRRSRVLITIASEHGSDVACRMISPSPISRVDVAIIEVQSHRRVRVHSSSRNLPVACTPDLSHRIHTHCHFSANPPLFCHLRVTLITLSRSRTRPRYLIVVCRCAYETSSFRYLGSNPIRKSYSLTVDSYSQEWNDIDAQCSGMECFHATRLL